MTHMVPWSSVGAGRDEDADTFSRPVPTLDHGTDRQSFVVYVFMLESVASKSE